MRGAIVVARRTDSVTVIGFVPLALVETNGVGSGFPLGRLKAQVPPVTEPVVAVMVHVNVKEPGLEVDGPKKSMVAVPELAPEGMFTAVFTGSFRSRSASMVYVADVPDFEGSATEVAVTVKVAGLGGTAGTV